MANNKYLRSVKRERELVNNYSGIGWVSFRTAGSKSKGKEFKIDVGAVNLGLNTVGFVPCVNFHQVKTKKGGRNHTETIIKTIKNATINLIWDTWG